MEKTLQKSGRSANGSSVRKRAAAAEPVKGSKRRLTNFGEIEIGMRLKHARLVKGMRLHELAKILDCSESFLSKIENKKVRPSLAMLHAITVALDISISQLFEGSGEEAPAQLQIVRAHERPIIRTDARRKGAGIELERLVASSKHTLIEANIHRVEPGGHTEGFITHEGEEIGYILEGQLELNLNGTVYQFKDGDTFFFRSNLPHGYRNPGKTVTRVLWVNTPPTF